MTTASKRKGSEAERDVVKYLRRRGWSSAERAYGAGRPDDVGDISGLEGVCIEVKNQKQINLAGWVEELIVEMRNARAETGAVVHKRRGKSSVAEWYATMPVSDWVDLLRKAGY